MRAYLTPDGWGNNAVQRCICIPNTPEWLALVGGALSTLLYPTSYEQFGSITPEQAAQMSKRILESFYMSCGLPAGLVMATVLQQPPPGFLLCDGTIYDVNDYPYLATALGFRYEASGGRFFVPQMTGMFLVGQDEEDPAISNLGDVVGTNNINLQIQHIPPHAHQYQGVLPNIDLEAPGAPDVVAAGINPFPVYTGDAGGGQPYRHLPYSMVVKFVISTGM